MTLNIALDREQFRTLVAGGIVTEEFKLADRNVVVRIILSDIGFPVMRKAIKDAQEAA